MAWPLPPATRRLVSWMFLIAGFLLLIGQLLRWWVVYQEYQRLGFDVISSTQVVLNLMLLVGALLLLRYGWRARRGNDTVD